MNQNQNYLINFLLCKWLNCKWTFDRFLWKIQIEAISLLGTPTAYKSRSRFSDETAEKKLISMHIFDIRHQLTFSCTISNDLLSHDCTSDFLCKPNLNFNDYCYQKTLIKSNKIISKFTIFWATTNHVNGARQQRN